MKKISALLLVVMMCLVLCGCCLKHDMTPATCTEPSTCTKCGKTEGEALGHTEEIDEAVEPTCTEAGLTEGKHCSVCGEILTAQEEIAALGHTEETDEAVEPTCAEAGLTEGKHCSVCGEVLVPQEEIEALPHTWQMATCTEPKTCSVCGETAGEALGHVWVPANLDNPKYCARCEITEGKAVKDETAAVINGKEYSTGYLEYAYNANYTDFLNNFGSYVQYFGYDPTLPADEQECTMIEDCDTWRDYFLKETLATLRVNRSLLDYAEEAGAELTEEEKSSLTDYINAYEETVKSYGYESLESAIADMFGPYATKDMIVQDAINEAVIQKAYTTKSQEVLESVGEDELKAYPRISVRHVLLQAKADTDEEGNMTFSQAALDTAKKRAEAVVRLFEATDRSEEAFAELAKLYSEDPGSKDVGGLYEAVEPGTTVEEFNAFCFDENRQPGDIAVVYGTNGAYAGYHVMFFVGENKDASLKAAAVDKMNSWYEEVVSSGTVETNDFCDYVGRA